MILKIHTLYNQYITIPCIAVLKKHFQTKKSLQGLIRGSQVLVGKTSEEPVGRSEGVFWAVEQLEELATKWVASRDGVL